MKDILDNPAFYALATGNERLSNGTDDLRYFHKEISPFIGIRELTPDSFRQLYDLVPHGGPIGYVSPFDVEIPDIWKLLNKVKGKQMIYNGGLKEVDSTALVQLNEGHIPQMMELTRLTNPGPFGTRTIDLGSYYGIFDGDRLVAMAGQRLNPLPFAEISAVCTHPEYSGRGYARQLVEFHINRIKGEGSIPILHVADGNDRPFELYKKIGFEIRSHMYFYILIKN